MRRCQTGSRWFHTRKEQVSCMWKACNDGDVKLESQGIIIESVTTVVSAQKAWSVMVLFWEFTKCQCTQNWTIPTFALMKLYIIKQVRNTSFHVIFFFCSIFFRLWVFSFAACPHSFRVYKILFHSWVFVLNISKLHDMCVPCKLGRGHPVVLKVQY